MQEMNVMWLPIIVLTEQNQNIIINVREYRLSTIGRRLGRCWVGVWSVLGRCWVGVGSVLGRCWLGVGSVFGSVLCQF